MDWKGMSFDTFFYLTLVFRAWRSKFFLLIYRCLLLYFYQFYAIVNGSSGLLQFVVLPFVMNKVEPKMVWRCIPILPMVCTMIMSSQDDPSLLLAATALFAAKCLDYSFRNVVNEMVYVSLDFDSRYLVSTVLTKDYPCLYFTMLVSDTIIAFKILFYREKRLMEYLVTGLESLEFHSYCQVCHIFMVENSACMN